jgi:hypothetical protein
MGERHREVSVGRTASRCRRDADGWRWVPAGVNSLLGNPSPRGCA